MQGRVVAFNTLNAHELAVYTLDLDTLEVCRINPPNKTAGSTVMLGSLAYGTDCSGRNTGVATLLLQWSSLCHPPEIWAASIDYSAARKKQPDEQLEAGAEPEELPELPIEPISAAAFLGGGYLLDLPMEKQVVPVPVVEVVFEDEQPVQTAQELACWVRVVQSAPAEPRDPQVRQTVAVVKVCCHC